MSRMYEMLAYDNMGGEQFAYSNTIYYKCQNNEIILTRCVLPQLANIPSDTVALNDDEAHLFQCSLWPLEYKCGEAEAARIRPEDSSAGWVDTKDPSIITYEGNSVSASQPYPALRWNHLEKKEKRSWNTGDSSRQLALPKTWSSTTKCISWDRDKQQTNVSAGLSFQSARFKTSAPLVCFNSLFSLLLSYLSFSLLAW